MAVVDVSCTLSAPADAVWAAARTPGAFRLVTRGLLRMPVIRRRRAPWVEGETVQGWILLFGLVPFSRHRLHIASIDVDARRLSSHERGGVVRVWNHDITIEPVDETSCRYRDRVELDAGLLTPLVAAWATVFYRIRQRRWRELAAALGLPPGESTQEWERMRRHETAFNTGRWASVMTDYTNDAVLEVLNGDERTVAVGREEVRRALEAASVVGVQTSVVGMAANDGAVTAVIDDDSGHPYMASIWVLREGRIARDVSVVLGAE